MAYRTSSNINAFQFKNRLTRDSGAVPKVIKSSSASTLEVGRKTSRPVLGHIDNVIGKEIRGKKVTKSVITTPEKSLQSVKESETSVVPSPSLSDVSDLVEAFSAQQLASVDDIDRDDHTNPQLVSEYVNDIYKYMLRLEREFQVRGNYMDNQEVNARMRSILVDWLVQVHLRFHLLQETLFLTVSILDRFLQEQPVSRNKLQLVGVTAMFIASKYEEMYAPEIGDFVYITDGAYTKAQIRLMECLMLKTLDFSLGKPLCLHFLRRNSKAGCVDAVRHTLAKYLMELTLQDYDFVQYHPSEIAASALYVSIKTLKSTDEWTNTLHYYSTYSEAKLLPIVRKMCKLLAKAHGSKLQAVKSKYASSKFMKISVVPQLKSTWITELSQQA